MASVYLNPVGLERPGTLDGVFNLSRVPGIGEIVQARDCSDDSEGEVYWLRITDVVHHDRKRDHAEVEAEVFGVLLSTSEKHQVSSGKTLDV